jgi:hypothetical protein
MLCISSQFLTGMYEGLFLACVMPAIFLDLLAMDRTKQRKLAIGLLLGAIATSMAVLLYSSAYFEAQSQVGERTLAEAAPYSATPSNFLAVHPRNWLLGPMLSQFGSAERELFPGICAVLLALLGLIKADRSVRVLLIVVAVIALDLTLGVNGVLTPALREVSSAFRGIRVSARAATILMLPIAIFAGVGFAWLTRKLRPILSYAATVGMITIICLEYRTPAVLWEIATPIDLRPFAIENQSVLVELPLPVPERLDENFDGLYMVSHIGQWPRLLNGYSGRYPQHYLDLLSEMRRFPDDSSLVYAQRHGATHLLVHERWMYDKYPSVLNDLKRSSKVAFVGAFNELDSKVAVFMFRAR